MVTEDEIKESRSGRPIKDLLPHQIPQEDEDSSSDYSKSPPHGTSSPQDVAHIWRPAKRSKVKNKQANVASESSPAHSASS
jgi:hypothetical protein